MATNTGFPQQRPLPNSSAVRSAPSQQHGAHMDVWRTASRIRPAEEKAFEAKDGR
ncbi:MAG: hypothetical protein JWO72_1663 [Caulobacteraceae bacterium]|jgi:hypothetical protein|nr:hypothetical protein [Caulobacteraceae bacterium]